MKASPTDRSILLENGITIHRALCRSAASRFVMFAIGYMLLTLPLKCEHTHGSSLITKRYPGHVFLASQDRPLVTVKVIICHPDYFSSSSNHSDSPHFKASAFRTFLLSFIQVLSFHLLPVQVNSPPENTVSPECQSTWPLAVFFFQQCFVFPLTSALRCYSDRPTLTPDISGNKNFSRVNKETAFKNDEQGRKNMCEEKHFIKRTNASDLAVLFLRASINET